MSKIDINVRKIQFSKNEYNDTQLILNFYGDDVNNFILNSLRKVCIDQVPTYAFDRSGIKILRDSSISDPTELSMHISLLPIYNIDYNIVYIPTEYYTKTDELKENILNIEYFVKIKNNEFETILDVTSNDVKISINDEIIPNEKMYDINKPIELCRLKYGQELELSMKAKLGVGETNAVFNASHTWFYDLNLETDKQPYINRLIELNNKTSNKSKHNKNKQKEKEIEKKNNYILVIESAGQLHELEILKRGVELIIIKLNNMKNLMETKYAMDINTGTEIIFDFEDEDFTCVGQLNYLLQGDKDVVYSGASKPNFLEKRINLVLTVNKEGIIPIVMYRNINKTIECYDKILSEIKNIL